MPEDLHHQEVQVGEPLGKIIPLELGDLFARLLGGKMVKGEHQAAEKLDLMGHIAQGPHRAAAFLDTPAIHSLRLKVVQPLLDVIEPGGKRRRKIVLDLHAPGPDRTLVPACHPESPMPVRIPVAGHDAAIHTEVQMDNVDFPAARSHGLDRGWTPLRDAVAALLKPLHARIVRAAEPAEPVAAPRLDTAPESWLSVGHDYCDRLMAEIRQPVPDPEPAEAVEVVDRAAYIAAIRDTAREEPATVAQARALLADPHAALEEPVAERQVAWLVALADLQHRREDAARVGGTAA